MAAKCNLRSSAEDTYTDEGQNSSSVILQVSYKFLSSRESLPAYCNDLE